MYWALAFAIELGAQFLISALLKKRGPKQKPGEPVPPRSREGDLILVVFGRQKVGAFSFFWEPGAPLPYTKDGGVFGDQPVEHYYYYARQVVGICRGPVDKLVDVVFDENRALSKAVPKPAGGRSLPISNPALGPASPILRSDHPGGVTVQVFAPYLYGGGAPAGAGGVIGELEVYWGTTTQTQNPTLTAWRASGPSGRETPAYRGLCYVVMHNGFVSSAQDPFTVDAEAFYLGDEPTQRSLYFVVQRNPSALLGAATAEIGPDGDCNPAEAIWQIITDADFLGRDPALYDRASFEAGALQFYDDGLGVSFTLADDSGDSAKDAIADIEKHTNCQLYRSPTTGLIALRLFRGDYSDAPGEILELEDGENCSDVEVSSNLPTEVLTELKVNYTSASQGYTTRQESVQNPAAHVLVGGRKIPEVVDLPWITSAENASRAGHMLMRAKTLELKRVSLTATRAAYWLARGAPFALRAPSRGLGRGVFRVVEIDYGQLEDGSIAIQGIEDVFSIAGALVRPSTGYAGPAPTAPGGVANHLIIVAHQSQTATVGTLSLEIDDPDAVVSEVALQVRQGGAAGAGFVADAAAPYEATVNLVDGVPSYIDYRVTFAQPDGSVGTSSGTTTFSAAVRPTAPRLSVEFDGSGNATIDSRGDGLTATHRIAYSTVSYPSDATTRAAPVQTGQDVSTTGGTVAEGGTLYVAAFAYDADGHESLKSIGAFVRVSDGSLPDLTPSPAGTYGNATHVAQVTVDTKGRVTGATNVAMSGGGGGGTSPQWVLDHPDTPPDTANAADDEFDTNGDFDTTGSRRAGATAWALLNTGGTQTRDQDKGCMEFVTPQEASLNLRGAYQVAPATPWKFRAKMLPCLPLGNYNFAGLHVYDDETGRLVVFGLNYSDGLSMFLGNHNSVTSYASDTHHGFGETNLANFPIYLEIENTGTNLVFRRSHDGRHWITEFTTTLTAWLTNGPRTVGICAENRNPTTQLVGFQWWRRIT